jgi:hypothetical protein
VKRGPTTNLRGIDAFHELERHRRGGEQSDRLLGKHLEARQELWRAAFHAAFAQKETLKRKLWLGEGVWWPELAPLTGRERGEILKELRHMWDLPEQHAK